ncbi:MAG: hypothetical protein MJK15_04990 [Colwellia sp.]|nr:hypothetical protein [Colwellia sp.]
MSEYEKLKETQKELGSAIACAFKKNGEMLIFVTANAEDDEVMKSLIQLSTQIGKYRKPENKVISVNK